MTQPTHSPDKSLSKLLTAVRKAMAAGDQAAARRMARLAVRQAPLDARTWLHLAATSSPRAGLAYAARALELDPSDARAHAALRWLVRKAQPAAQAKPQAPNLPAHGGEHVAPLAYLGRWSPLTPGAVVVAIAVVIGWLVWVGNTPADAGNSRLAAAPVAKVSHTPTITSTPSPTATATATETPVPSLTPIPSETPTAGPALSWEFIEDPIDLAHEGRWIDVDLGEQRLTAYDGASPIKSFVVSTGTWRHPTVTGQFRVYVKLTATTMAGPGYYLPGVPYTMYFYRGYALHGTYWHNNFGTPMSHGCVNLETGDAEWVFDFARVGTLVNVHP